MHPVEYLSYIQNTFRVPLVCANLMKDDIPLFSQYKVIDENDYQAAIAKYREVIENFPDTEEAVEAQYRIGNVYQWNLVEPEEAIAEYQKVIEMNPSIDYVAQTLIRIGESYGRMRQFDKIVEYFKQVIEKYPESEYVPMANIRLANTHLFELHDSKKAKPIYEAILSEYSQSSFAAEARVWLEHIHQLQRGIRKEDAVIYQQIISDYPEHMLIVFSLGFMLYSESHAAPPVPYVTPTWKYITDGTTTTFSVESVKNIYSV